MPHELPPPRESLAALVARLIADGRAFGQAQVALYRAQASRWIGKAKTIAILGVVALILVHVAIITLFVGLVLTLAPVVGPGFATLIVVLGTLAVAALLGWLAYRRIGGLSADKVTS